MEKFDQKYFEDIWGTVHRHDYCADRARMLIEKYGRVRFLDIGTGCGYLVKCLRDMGAEAYGMDISLYAVENSHGNVVLGDVCNIPFKDDSFDVVHSSGLLEYVKEDMVDTAINECYRVGKIQDHNIDHDKTDWQPEYKYETWKPIEWWNDKLKKPKKVLVTCPTYEGKEYCFQEWIDNVKNLTYPNYDILVVDNSPTDAYVKKYGDQVPMVHIDFTGQKDHPTYRMCKSMAYARGVFLKGEYTHWMNIEADNIPPKDVIETMMKYGVDADWVAHAYFIDGKGGNLEQGIGCSLLSRKLIEDFDMNDDTIFDDSPDAEMWNWVQQKGIYKTVELWYIMDVKHKK